MSNPTGPRGRRKRPTTSTLNAYVALRLNEKAYTLGAIDWLLWGRASNPFFMSHAQQNAYNKGFADEKAQTPRPPGTRIRSAAHAKKHPID